MDPVTILELVQMLRRGSRKKKGGLGMLGIKNLLALVGLVVVAFVGAGWYFGWYKIGDQKDAQGHRQLSIQVDPSQVAKDLKKIEQEVVDGFDKTKAAVAPATTEPAPLPVQTYTLPPVPLPAVEIQVHQQTPPLPPPSPPKNVP
jgi:hypothetical protein